MLPLLPAQQAQYCEKPGPHARACAWKSGWRRRKRAYCRFMPSASDASIAEQCAGVRYSSTSTAVACIMLRRLRARKHLRLGFHFGSHMTASTLDLGPGGCIDSLETDRPSAVAACMRLTGARTYEHLGA